MAPPYFVPSADLLPYWPHDLIATSDVGMLGRVSQYLGVTEFDLIEYEGALTLVGKLALWRQVVLDLPLIDGIALVIGQPGLNLTSLPFELNFGPPAEDRCRRRYGEGAQPFSQRASGPVRAPFARGGRRLALRSRQAAADACEGCH
jgi:hypothetical protein